MGSNLIYNKPMLLDIDKKFNFMGTWGPQDPIIYCFMTPDSININSGCVAIVSPINGIEFDIQQAYIV